MIHIVSEYNTLYGFVTHYSNMKKYSKSEQEDKEKGDEAMSLLYLLLQLTDSSL